MSDFLIGFTTALIPTLAWLCGYHYGKADGIRKMRHLLDEQWSDYKTFRDLVFHELGIEEQE